MIFGLILISGYEYINISNKKDSGETCLWAALIYTIISILCLIYLKKQSQDTALISNTLNIKYP